MAQWNDTAAALGFKLKGFIEDITSAFSPEEQGGGLSRGREKSSVTLNMFGYDVYFGMEWYVVNGASDRDSILDASYQANSRFGVFMEESPDASSGKQVYDKVLGLPFGKQTLSVKKSKSAAQVAAVTNHNSVIVHKINDDSWWLLALSNGLPIIGKDVVADQETVTAIASELIEAFPDFSCVGDAQFWRSLNVDSDLIVATALNEMLSEERLKSSSPMTTLRADVKTVRMKLAAVAVLGVLLWFSGDIYRALVEQSAASQERSYQESWDNQILRANQEVTQEFNQLSRNHPIGVWIERLMIAVDQLRLESRGWLLSSVECGAGLPYCTVTWGNTGLGTFLGLSVSMSSLGEIDFVSPIEAQQNIQVPFSRVELPENVVRDRISNLPGKEEFKLVHVSLLQALSGIPSVSAGVDIGEEKSIGFKGSTPTGVVDRIERIPAFEVGEWRLKGEGIRVLIGSLQKLDPYVFFGRSLVVEFQSERGRGFEFKARWSVEGSYVVRQE